MKVDFSSKHDILLHHKDGSYSPMDQPYYEVKQIDDATWQIMSSGDYHYLLAGDEEGISIDTGYGAGNLREYLEGLCGKPVPAVINTHFHFDHSANNCYFDRAYMGKEALDKVSIPYKSFAGMDFFPDSYEKIAVGDGDIIPLKGRELEIFRIGDHSECGIAMLDRGHRILFSGDEIMGNGKRLNGPVSEWLKKLEQRAAHRDEFDVLYGGPDRFDAEEFDINLEAAKRICAGIPSNEPVPEPPKGFFLVQPDHDGHRVYDCQLPHIEDVPVHNPDDPTEDTETVYVYKGRLFRYKEI